MREWGLDEVAEVFFGASRCRCGESGRLEGVKRPDAEGNGRLGGDGDSEGVMSAIKVGNVN